METLAVIQSFELTNGAHSISESEHDRALLEEKVMLRFAFTRKKWLSRLKNSSSAGIVIPIQS
jgi:hypothetical protein